MRLKLSESFPKTIGRYELIDRLAIGGMAELFLARSTSPVAPSVPVVIKRLLPHMVADPYFTAMFIDEAKLTTRLAHPNIAGTIELGRDGDLLYMVMEYIEGIDCLALLRECARQQMRLPATASVYIAHEVLDALDFAHTQVDDHGQPMGIVHRDISPSNVLLSRRGEVKLVDFGIAQAASRKHKTKDGTLKGKYGYMSPEQVLEENIDARSDVFSVGIVLAELLTGRRLFAARNELDVLLMVRDVNLSRLERYGQHVNPELQAILRTAMAKRPDDRYATAAEFRDVLSLWLDQCQPRVSRSSIAFVVESLYDSIREHARKEDAKRATEAAQAAQTTAPPASAPAPVAEKSVAGANAESKDETSAIPTRSLPAELSDAWPQVDLIDGIPSGHMDSSDSLPVVSIERGDSMPVVYIERGDTSGHVAIDISALSSLSDGVVVPAEGSGDEWLSIELSDVVVLSDSSDMDAVPSMIEEMEISELFPSAPTPAMLEASRHVAEDARDFDDSLVSREEGRRSHADSAAVPTPDRTRRAPDDTGDFMESPPIAVLYRLSITRATGMLEARSGKAHKAVYFREGIPEYVWSNLGAERFGSYLVRNGILSPGELSMALAMMPHYGGKLGDTVVALGLLKPLDVFRLLTKQVREKLIDLCAMQRGHFAWFGGHENPYDSFPLDLNAFEILGAAAMQLPDDMVYDWMETLPLGCHPCRQQNPRVSPEVFQLDDFIQHLFNSLNGEFQLSELLEFYQEQNQQEPFLRTLYLLAQTQLLSFSE